MRQMLMKGEMMGEKTLDFSWASPSSVLKQCHFLREQGSSIHISLLLYLKRTHTHTHTHTHTRLPMEATMQCFFPGTQSLGST